MEKGRASRIAAAIGVLATATVLMAQTELLPNGNFGKGDSAWNLGTSAGNGSTATEAVADSQCVISINAAGYYEYSVQFSDTLLTILNGHTYHIRIVAMSSLARPFTYGVGKTNTPWTTYSGVNNVGEMVGNLGTAMDTIDTTFTMAFPDDNGGARIFLNFGHAAGWPTVDNSTVTISSVILEDITNSKVLALKALHAAKTPVLSLNSRGISLGRTISPSATLKVFSVQGRLLEDLSANARQTSQLSWSSTGLKSGSFIVRLVDEGKQSARSAIVTQ
jgi:hypothetical protein